jgi:HAD superfamily hydrolase (TIGR01509 family)
MTAGSPETRSAANGSKCNTRLVCFDLGGVLVRICRSWEEARAAAGIPERPLPVADVHSTNAIRDLVHQHQIGRVCGEQFAVRYSTLINCVYSVDEVRSIHKAWLLGEYSGVVELIDQLHCRGIETAALSNTNETHWRQMADYAAFQRLRYPLASHLLKLAKPDPAIYRAAEQHLSARGSSIVFFDDFEENVQAACDAGWNAHLIDPHGCPATQMQQILHANGML